MCVSFHVSAAVIVCCCLDLLTMDVMREVTQQRLMKERELSARCDRARMLDLRFKFLDQAKHYFGVPYKKKYHEPGTEEHNSPLFLDCCGLVRRVLLDLKEDFGFTVGRWNQAYQFDTLPMVVEDEAAMEPGDLVFISGIYNDAKRKKQKHNMVHVEIWAGDGKRTVGARWQKGKVQVHDSYRFEAKSYHSMTYHFRSIDTWLRGICKSYCKQHPWKRSNFKPSKRSVFAREEQLGSDEDDDSGDDAVSQEMSTPKNQLKGCNVTDENVNPAGESNGMQKKRDGWTKHIPRSADTRSFGSDVVQNFATPPPSGTHDENGKEKQNISGDEVRPEFKSIIPGEIDLPGCLTKNKACGGGEFTVTTEGEVEIHELTSKGHWKESDIISKESDLQVNLHQLEADEPQLMPQRRCHRWAEMVDKSEKEEDYLTGYAKVSLQHRSDRVNFDPRVKHQHPGFELDFVGDVEHTKSCNENTITTQTECDMVIDDLVDAMSSGLGNMNQNSGTLLHKPDANADVLSAPHLPVDRGVDIIGVVNIGCVSNFNRPDLKRYWTTREEEAQTTLPSQRHATREFAVKGDLHVFGPDSRLERPGVPQPGELEAALGGDSESGRSDHCSSVKSDLVVYDLDDTESIPRHVPKEVAIHRDETYQPGEVEEDENVTKMSIESTEGSAEMPHQLVEGEKGQMFIHNTLEERDAEDHTSLDEGEEGLIAGSCETPQAVGEYLPVYSHHTSCESLMPMWNNSTCSQEVALEEIPFSHQSVRAGAQLGHQTIIPTDADDPKASPSQSSGGGSFAQQQFATGSGGAAAAAACDENETSDNMKGEDDENEDKDDKRKPTANGRKPVCKADNTPMFYVGGHNGVSLVEEPLLAKGWQRIQDPKSDRFKLRWVEIKSQINYSSFRPGEQLINRIPGSGMLATKTGLFNTLRDFERLNGRLKRGNSAKSLKTSDFFPESYVLDMKADREAFFQTFKEGEIWICKPNNMNQGKGIYLVRDLVEIKAKYQNEGSSGALPRLKVKRGNNQRLIQRYLPNPLLLNGKKFDVRTYMLIACTSPFVVFYHSGYCRLSCEDYDPESKDLARHLTNQYQQKKVPQYKDMKDETVWSMERFNEYINTEIAEQHGLPDDWVFGPFTKRMHQVMTHCFHAVKNKLDTSLGLFDLLGFDFIIDTEMKIWLLEVNVNPALHTNCDVLKEKLPPMIAETLEITLEIFEKSRKREKILPIRSMKNFHLLYSATSGGSRRANVTAQRSKSISPVRTAANPHSLVRNKGAKSTLPPPKSVSVTKEKGKVKVHTPQATRTVEIKKTGTKDGMDSSEKKSK